jgi:ABC-type antimicrobial peptide transport system permease subunit
MLERRREQGILKAVGYTSRGILAQTLIEQGIAGVLAGLLAMGCAALAAIALARISFQVEIGVSLLVVAAVVLGSAALCVAIGSGVAWSAARVRPLEVLRYE